MRIVSDYLLFAWFVYWLFLYSWLYDARQRLYANSHHPVCDSDRQLL